MKQVNDLVLCLCAFVAIHPQLTALASSKMRLSQLLPWRRPRKPSKHEQIMSALNQLNARLQVVESTLTKISGESTATLAELVLLREQLGNTQLPDDAEATLARIETKVKTIDDLVPDAPAPTPENPPA